MHVSRMAVLTSPPDTILSAWQRCSVASADQQASCQGLSHDTEVSNLGAAVPLRRQKQRLRGPKDCLQAFL